VSIRWRLTLFIALAIGAILPILGVALFFLLRGALLSNVENTTRQRAENAAGSIREGAPLDREDIEDLSLDGVFVIARDERGRVLTKTVDLPKVEAETPSGEGRSTRASLPRARRCSPAKSRLMSTPCR
jgi:two-component system, OmpR family, sensor kinase